MKAITRKIEHKVEVFNSNSETHHPDVIKLKNGIYVFNSTMGILPIRIGDLIMEELNVDNPKIINVNLETFEKYFEIVEEKDEKSV